MGLDQLAQIGELVSGVAAIAAPENPLTGRRT